MQKIFIASSGDLAKERVELETLLYRNQFNPILWENAEQSITTEEFQSRLNKDVATSQIVIFMVRARFGKNTKREFDFAYARRDKGIEKIYVYFLAQNIHDIEPNQIKNIIDFKTSIENSKSIHNKVDNFEVLRSSILQEIIYWKASQMASSQNAPMSTAPTPTAPIILPLGQVPKDSVFYINRDDSKAYTELTSDYSLILIKAPRQYGKTSLLSRLIREANRLDYQVVIFSFTQLRSFLNNLEKLLFYICRIISKRLKIDSDVDLEKDADIFTPTDLASDYMESILSQLKAPLVLAIDEADKLFEYSDVSHDFFGLIRAWNEESKTNDDWSKLKIILSYSTDPLLVLPSLNNSAFDNVSMKIELKAFNLTEIESLVTIHNLELDNKEMELFQTYIGGHPYLTRKVLYDIATEGISLAEALKIERFDHHLQKYITKFEDNPQLIKAIREVEKGNCPDVKTCYILESTGFITHHGGNVKLSCKLYSEFFEKHFGDFNYE